MKKAVMISINKPHTDNIRAGLKKLEVRKNFPKDGFLFLSGFCPFVTYMYETKRGGGCGKVIGEFVCDDIEKFWCDDGLYYPTGSMKKQTCLTNSEMLSYGKGKPLYGWHIANLKIYDKPKEISEFRRPYKYDGDGLICGTAQEMDDIYEWDCETIFGEKYPNVDFDNMDCEKCPKAIDFYRLKRPFQSWCYVEELKGEKL